MVIRVESLGLNLQHMESLREDSNIQDRWLSSLPNLLSGVFCRLSLKILAGLFRTNSYWQKSTSLKNRNDILLVASTGASKAGESFGCTVRFRKLSQVVSFLNICSSHVCSGVLGVGGCSLQVTVFLPQRYKLEPLIHTLPVHSQKNQNSKVKVPSSARTCAQYMQGSQFSPREEKEMRGEAILKSSKWNRVTTGWESCLVGWWGLLSSSLQVLQLLPKAGPLIPSPIPVTQLKWTEHLPPEGRTGREPIEPTISTNPLK